MNENKVYLINHCRHLGIINTMMILSIFLLMGQALAMAASADTIVDQIIGLTKKFPALKEIETSRDRDGLPPSHSERAKLLDLTPVPNWQKTPCTKIDRSQYRHRYQGNLPQSKQIITEFDVNDDGLCETYEKLPKMCASNNVCLSRLITQKVNTTASTHKWPYRLENIGDINGLSITQLYKGRHGYAFIETQLPKNKNEVVYLLYEFNGKEYRPIREDTYAMIETNRHYHLKKTKVW